MKIAVLLTCFNRKDKTISCLTSLYHALDVYNENIEDKIDLFIYLTDDGCTDGTADAVRNNFANKNITILQGDGNLYWAGGMRFAWKEALKNHDIWDFYLLVNDDTTIGDTCFYDLMEVHQFSLEKYNKQGIYSGITCDPNNKEIITYGGRNVENFIAWRTKKIIPNGVPQLCDLTNANILLIPKSVVDKVGIFWDGYTHIGADFDYSIQCNKKNIPCYVTGRICGYCGFDHRNADEEKNKILSMTLSERKEYFNHPIHSSKDIIKFKKRNTPLRYPFVAIGRFLNLYFPRLYYALDNFRR